MRHLICKHYTKRITTIREYIGCLYKLEDCICGGLLHIVTDDGNIEDWCIQSCLEDCENHPEREEAEIGKLICRELLKLNMEQRRLVLSYGISNGEAWCDGHDRCDRCPIHNPDASWV